MKHHRSRRGIPLLAAVATLAGGAFTTVTSAATTAGGLPRDGQQAESVLDLLLQLVLNQVLGGTIATVQGLIDGLSPTQVGDLLVSGTAAENAKLVPAAQLNGQLDGALGTLTVGETGGLLGKLSGANLGSTLGVLNLTEISAVFGTLTSGPLASAVDGLTAGQTGGLLSSADATQLTRLLGALTSGQLSGGLGALDAAGLIAFVGDLAPAQIGELLGAGASASVIDGLLGSATALGGAPAGGAIDGLVGQLTALLDGGVPAVGDLTDLASLLGVVDPLLSRPGVDTALLGSLLSTVNGVLAIAPLSLTGPLQTVVTTIGNVLDPVLPGGGPTTPPAGTTTPPAGTTTTPGSTTIRPGTTIARSAAAGTPGPYRATLSAIKVSKRRTSMKFTLSCPKAAPKGCLVALSAKIAGQKAIRTTTLALPSGRSTPVTVTLSKSTTKRLKRKGGALTVTARTANSTLSSATQTVKVKRAKAKRKLVKR